MPVHYNSPFQFGQGQLRPGQYGDGYEDFSGGAGIFGQGSLGNTFTPKPGANTWDTPLGRNIGTGQLALGGLQSLGNLWSSMQASNLAKKQFEFTKNFANTNLANQLKSYNTRLEGKTIARGATQGEAPGWAEDYIARNRLTRDNIS